jgi:membrane protease subunit HflK
MRYVFYLLLVVFAASLLTGVTQIRPGERAVIWRFGRLLDDKPGPGLYVGLPWGMDQVERVQVDLVRRVEVGYQPGTDEGSQTPVGQLLTGDHNLVNVQVLIDYSIIDEEVENYVVQKDRVDGLVARAAETALTEWVAERRVDTVLRTGKGLLPRWLVQQTQDRLRGYRLGIRIQQASIAYLYPPDEVKPDFDQVTAAETSIRTREFEARQEAARLFSDAEAEKFRIEQDAQFAARELLHRAAKQALTFEKQLAQYQKLAKDDPYILNAIWWNKMMPVLRQMRQNRSLDLLDNYLSGQLDITEMVPSNRK